MNVIYKVGGSYCVTDECNYHAYVRDARKVRDCSTFDSPSEIVDYYCKYFGTSRDDFKVIDYYKYYVEMSSCKDVRGYVMQSKWFNSETEAVNFANMLDYVDDSQFILSLMRSTWNVVDDTCEDIEFVRVLN